MITRETIEKLMGESLYRAVCSREDVDERRKQLGIVWAYGWYLQDENLQAMCEENLSLTGLSKDGVAIYTKKGCTIAEKTLEEIENGQRKD